MPGAFLVTKDTQRGPDYEVITLDAELVQPLGPIEGELTESPEERKRPKTAKANVLTIPKPKTNAG